MSKDFKKDAALTVFIIGAVSALVAVTVTLIALISVEAEFHLVHWNAALGAALGWMALPFLPRIYRAKMGCGFFETRVFDREELQ